ncbi:pyruvate, phosphate dikinase [bacterium]|nr:pyruvate, phosphate dikinase [bacterium]
MSTKSKKAAKKKFVYFFGNGKAEGNGTMRDLLGGKGAGLAEMTDTGVPVPAGFTITTETCNLYYDNNRKVPAGLDDQIKVYLVKLEKAMNKKFGDPKNPLLVSVRSGSKFSMPGMMDTILNLGLNDVTVQGLVSATGNDRFAYDSYRRFIQMFGNVVLDIEKEDYEKALSAKKREVGTKLDTELTSDDLKDLIMIYKKITREKAGQDFPQDPMKQMTMSRDAVFRSWNNDRAIYYRKMNGIPDDLGTAVNIQAMVFGNMGNDSGTGVGFTRNPSTGENVFYGEYLTNAQGEDVVAGVRTPLPIAKLEEEMPKVFKQLHAITMKLEKHYKDIQDFEFTIEKGKLFMLQTRSGKRTAAAAIRIAVEMMKEKLITKDEAIKRVEPSQLDQLLHPIIDPKADFLVVAKGLPASPGAGAGRVVFTAEDAVKWAEEMDEDVILVREETCPDDIHGMEVAKGILTARGGMTSHAAVVARGMGKCCVAGCEDVRIGEGNKSFEVGGKVFKEGDWITLDGGTGRVIEGKVPTKDPDFSAEYDEFMTWVDQTRKLKVRANADIPRDADKARTFGAEGIGLCRTEHMFFAEDRLAHMQAMILAPDEEGRRTALEKLLPMQRSDFKGLFDSMKGYPVTIRLLDPPLHEFLPKREELMVEIARLEATNANAEDMAAKKKLLERVNQLHELNPMLGHRGCRLGIAYPEITEMQVRAIAEAASKCNEEGNKVVPEIMIPLVGNVLEYNNQKAVAERIIAEVKKEKGIKFKYMIGTMIELPRAAVTADEIAKEAEFFSFGTNDLTQTTFGFSRDDTGSIITQYVDNKIMEKDPFQTIDVNGVGQLVEMAVDKGRMVRPGIKLGICGEHGGDPTSVKFCHKVGLDYVSCSPYRVPIARLAAAHATLGDKAAAKGSKKKSAKKAKTAGKKVAKAVKKATKAVKKVKKVVKKKVAKKGK